jgi:catechol 2,3-dioxygenase-like lactoylglutathione lyase family enzyme
MPDVGLTHVALTCRDTTQSAAFYAQVAGLQVDHHRPFPEHGGEVIWLGDGRHAFVVVLIPVDGTIAPLSGPLNHLGVACATRGDVDQRIAIARALGAHIDGPHD